LVVELQKNVSLYRARSTQRNFVADYLKGNLGTTSEKDAALVAFVSPDSDDWRFSLVKMDYRFEEKPSGKVKVKDKFTPAKRWSFLVGKNEKSHTAQSRFLPILENDNLQPTLEVLEEAFNVEVVTKEFYKEIANWYYWALKESRFPNDVESKLNGRNLALIRLIARIIFIWFMRQKGIIRKELFDKEFLKGILKDLSDNEATYYKAILQNLFFATLNTPIEQRKFRREEKLNGYLNKDYMNHTYFRYHNLFKNPNKMQELFNDIPFLNGGLFECLDKRKDDESNETGREIRIDGFSDDPKKQPYLPNILFFSEEREIDLNEDYGTKNKRYRVKGLINILKSYNFTIDENTPVDEEIALDPELLGRVFENLLASYNPETATTARKATGSYYTPREIVDYMVRESLKEYFKVKIPCIDEESLNRLFLYDEESNPFDEETTEKIINAVNNLKIIDPAVGSGAFPMGMLHTLVNILHKLDTHNEKWKAEQIKAVQHILDPQLKQETLKRIDESFTLNELDYGRKLYLIQNCIYGIDIQPIAIQIAKLRFFISLLVDERVDKTEPNYGIETLPNLETKFVSANTLIGLKRPKWLEQLSFQTNDVKKLEHELKEIRGQYFITTNTKEKERLKKKDKELRKALAESLSKGGWESDTTEKIARWNPYDTNKSADWFDPEWMFGVTDGFDIVIANPPYVSVKSISSDDKFVLSKEFETGQGRFNLFTLFLEKGHKLLSVNGILTFIIPEGLYSHVEYRYTRNYLLNNATIILINLFSNKVFEAAVDTTILLIKNSKNNQMRFCVYKDLQDKILELNQKIFQDYPFNLFAVNMTSQTFNIINRFINNKSFDILENILEIQQGIIYSGQPKNKVFANFPKDRTFKKVLDGRDILRWRINWDDKIDNKYISYTDKLHRSREERLFIAKEKILLPRKSTKIACAYDDKQFYALNTAYICLLKNNDYNIKYILSLLNSKFINFFYSSLFFGWQITIPALNTLPIKKIYGKLQQPFITLVDQILSITKDDDYLQNPKKQSQVKEFEKQIDQLVYELYDLTYEEIKIIEGELYSKE